MPYQHNKRPDGTPSRRPRVSADGRTARAESTGRQAKRRPIDGQDAFARSPHGTHTQRRADRQPTSNARRQTRAEHISERSNMRATRYGQTASQTHEQENWERLLAGDERPRARTSRDRTTQRTSQNRRRSFPIVPVIIAIIAIIAIAFTINSCTSCSSGSNEEEIPLAASDRPAAEATTITLSFAGDCTLGTDESFDRSTSFNAKYDAVDDPSYFFANVADIFANDDATIVNMEGTLTDSTTRADKTFAFKAAPEYAQILVEGNVEAASLANNHSHDYGEKSYTDTIEAVEAVGIPTFGYDRIAYLDVKGVKVALIGTYELAEGAGIKDEMLSNINAAKEAGAQVIVVYFHWGTERETVPDSVQMELGHAAIDAGATLVVGSHPHVIQGIEEYNGHQIVYSLGNFCFGGNKNPSDKDCMIFQATFTVQGDHVTTDSTEVIPCSISSVSSSNNYQPTPATGDEKERIAAKIKRSSDAIAQMAASFGS